MSTFNFNDNLIQDVTVIEGLHFTRTTRNKTGRGNEFENLKIRKVEEM